MIFIEKKLFSWQTDMARKTYPHAGVFWEAFPEKFLT